MATSQSNQTYEVEAPQCEFFYQSGPQDDVKLETKDYSKRCESCDCCLRCYNDEGECECMSTDVTSDEEEMEWEDAQSDGSFFVWKNYPTERWNIHERAAAIEDEEPADSDPTDFIQPPQEDSDDQASQSDYNNWPELEQSELKFGMWEGEYTFGEDTVQRYTEERFPVTRSGENFILHLPAKPTVKLPMGYNDYIRITTPYTIKSPFFHRFFETQIEYRGEEEFMELFNEFLADAQRKDEGEDEYWYHCLFGYKRYRDEIVNFFNLRTVRAEAEVREDTAEKEVNTTFVSQREETQDTGFMTGQVSIPAQHISMPEREYHVRTVMAKPILTFSSAWTSSMEPGTYITEKLLPGDFITGPHYNQLSTFLFTRFTCKLRFQINSNKFNKGYLIVAFIPQFQDSTLAKDYFSVNNLIALPHGKIDASLSNTVTLTIPFAHTHTYFNTARKNDYEYLGRVVLVVFNRLGATTGAPSTVDITCWTSFEDAELHQPSDAHDVILPRAQAGIEGVLKTALPLVKDLVAPGASMSSGNVGGAAANCDKPTDPTPIQRWVPNAVPTLNFGEGIDRTTRLSLKPGTATEHTADMIQTTQDDMNIGLLTKVPTRITTWTVSTGQGPESLVGALPCYPTLASTVIKDEQVDPPVNVYELPVLAYFSRSCKYYRGGLTYTFMAAANQMTSARFQIAFIPGGFETIAGKARYYNVVYWDVQEKHTLTVTVPYMSERPWLRCDKILAISELKSFDQTISFGTLVMHVVNRVNVPDAAATTIDISVLVSGATDFELAFPTDLSFYSGSGSVFVPKYSDEVEEEEMARAHAATSDTITTREDKDDTIMINGIGILGNVTASTMSEGAMDMKTTTRRYQKVYENTVTADENSVISFVNTPLLGSVAKRFNNNNGQQFRTLLAHYGEAMTFWKGSLRYTLVLHSFDTTKTEISEILHTPGVFLNNFTPGNLSDDYVMILGSSEVQGVLVGSSQIQASYSWEVPFYTPYQQLKTLLESRAPGVHWTARNATGTVFIRLNGVKGTKYRLSLYQAAGDDFSYNYFRAVPRVQFKDGAERSRQTEDGYSWLYNVNYTDYPGGAKSNTVTREQWTKDTQTVITIAPNTLTKTMQKEKDTNTQAQTRAHGLWDSVKAYLPERPRNPYTTVLDAFESVTTTNETIDTTIQAIANRINLYPTPVPEDQGIFSTLNSFMSGLPSLVGSSIGIAGNIAALVSGFQAYLTAESTFVKACAIVAIIRELLGGVLTWAAEKLTQLAITLIEQVVNGGKQGNQPPGVQAQAEILEFLPVLVAVATAALVVLGFKSIPNDKDTQDVCKTVSERLRLFNFSATALSNVKALYRQMKELTEWLMEEILMLTAPQYLAQLKLKQGFEDIENWAQFIDETEDSDYETRAQFDREFKLRCLRAADQANKYARMRTIGKLGPRSQVIGEYIRRIKKIGDGVRDAWRKLPVRVDPLCICVKGVTAVGKSASITTLAFEIMDRLGYPVENRWCPHNPSEKYFTENYTGQDAIYMDDISLFKTPEQYAMFASLKSNTKLPLVMAFNKGQLFNSDFIFTTTNTLYPAPNECNDLVALQRRRDILIEASWANRQIQRQVQLEGRNELRANFDHMRFRIKPSVEPQLADQAGLMQGPETRWMNFADLLDYVEGRAYEYFRGQDALIRNTLRTMHIDVPEEYDARQDLLLENQYRRHNPALEAAAAQEQIIRDIAEAIEDDGQDIFQDAEDNAAILDDVNDIPVAPIPPVNRNVVPDALANAGDDDKIVALDLVKARDQRWLGTFPEEVLAAVVYDEDLKDWKMKEGSDDGEELIIFLDEERKSNDRQRTVKENLKMELRRASELETTPEYRKKEIEEEIASINVFLESSEVSAIDQELNRCKKVKRWTKLKTAAMEKLHSLRTFLSDLWDGAKEKLPWLSCLESWPAKLLGVAICIFGVAGIATKVIHKCYCHSLRYMGYRCHLCGRWPVLDHNLNQSWILQEWQRIYGSEDYSPGRITEREEEEQYFDVMGEKPLGIYLGTKKSCEAQAGSCYSDITRGTALKHVVANIGPYSDVTNGAALNRVVAHMGRPKEIVDNRVIPALYRVRVVRPTQSISVNALAIGGKNVMLNKHFLDIAEMNGSFEMYHSNAWLPVLYEKTRVTLFKDKDLAVVNIPTIHMHKDLTGHFVEEDALKKMKKTAAILVEQNTNRIPVVHTVTAEGIDQMKYLMAVDGRDQTYVTRGMWKYDSVCTAGSCGSVLMTTENKSAGMILGIHTAGDVRTGYATLITREMISSVVGEGRLGTPLPRAEFLVSPIVPEGHFGHIGRVERGIYQSDKTTIIPTAIQGMVAPILTEPAVLSSRDPRLEVKKNIMKSGIAKYGKVPIPFDLEHRRMISEDLREQMENWTLSRTPCVLTDSEAICGIDGLEGFDRLPLNTSPGYPWVLSRPNGESGKAYLFDSNGQRIENEELKRKFEMREALARRGERVESVWTCCLKDERRPLAKVKAGSTRLFIIPPVDYSLLERKYMQDYSVALKDNRRTSPSKVGIDPQSLEWTELYNYIATFSNFVFAGDFTQFDGTLAPDLTTDFYADADYFYQRFSENWNEGDRKVRATLSDEGIHTVCLANDVAILTHTGNKSGNPNTVNKNGDVNARYIALAYLGLAQENEKLATMAEFHKNVRVAVYGDDNIVAVKPEVLDWFNQVTVTAFLARFGIVYTNATKTGEVKPYISLEEMTFLKQSFRDHETIKGVKVPHMAEQTITELLNWTRIAPDQDELLESNCNDALRFAYFRGFDYFKDLRARILTALKAKRKNYRVMTYNDFHYWFLFVCGVLPCQVKCQAMFETIASSGNGEMTKKMMKLIQKIPYAIVSMTGLLAADETKDKTDDRYAIAIPSGEGKSWLCKNHPELFVDHDAILLPEAARRLKEKGLNWKHLWEMLKVDYPVDDRRILLVHHPNNTGRKIIGSYKLPRANYIRANAYQRARLPKDAKVLTREERNKEIIKMAMTLEPTLGQPRGLTATSPLIFQERREDEQMTHILEGSSI